MSRRFALYALLTIAAAARLLMQASAMPPYAGLDEIYHVARLAFVAQEHRNPNNSEPSIPPYLDRSIHQDPRALPSFAQIGAGWQDVVRDNAVIVKEDALAPSDLRPYAGTNYESQQPSLFYWLAAWLHGGSAVDELRRWRLFSVFFAIVIVLATAFAGEALFGERGIAAATVLLLLPTWFTLVVRASNDALACALLACAFAMSFRATARNLGGGEARVSSSASRIPRSARYDLIEGLLWAGAFATKLYTWPAAIVLPLLWRKQKAPLLRIVLVTSLCVAAAAATFFDLHRRTTNALETSNVALYTQLLRVFAFNGAAASALRASINVGEIVRVTIASAAWTGGQHLDALRPLAIAIYLGPVLITLLIAIGRRKPSLQIAVAALLAFGAAQLFNIVAVILAGHAEGSIPLGKEGWYWYALAPIVIATIVPPLLERRLAVVAIAWMLVWDIVITEGALFHDYAGATSPAHGSLLFRWGPLLAPFTARLNGVAVGPLTSAIPALRIVHVLATAFLIALVLRHRMPAWHSASASASERV
ncbi:MAG TPA: hypothetical protein VF980_09980 [Thermoanaerobaculia bacterium]